MEYEVQLCTNKHGVDTPVEHTALFLKLLCKNSQKVNVGGLTVQILQLKSFLVLLQNMRYCDRAAIVKSEHTCKI